MAERIYEIKPDFQILNNQWPKYDKSQKYFWVLPPQHPKLQTKKVTMNSFVIQTPKPRFISNPLKTKLNKEFQYKLKRRARFKQNQPISASHK